MAGEPETTRIGEEWQATTWRSKTRGWCLIVRGPDFIEDLQDIRTKRLANIIALEIVDHELKRRSETE